MVADITRFLRDLWVYANSMRTGNRTSFRTDAAISNSRFGGERPLQRWDGGSAGEGLEDNLDKTDNQKPWDQFDANNRLFGLNTDYDENIYTTPINKSHPEYRQRVARAEQLSREIERTAPATAHVAEERIMDFAGGDNRGDEEDKYAAWLWPRPGFTTASFKMLTLPQI